MGLLAFFAPCTVAMLPAYLGFFLGRDLPAPAAPLAAARAQIPMLRAYAALAALAGAALLVVGALAIVDRATGVRELSPVDAAAVLAGVALLVLSGYALVGAEARRGLRIGLVTTAGLLSVFLLIGLPASAVPGLLNAATLGVLVAVVAIALVALGILSLAGKDFSLAIPFRAPATRTDASFFAFGAGYGLVSFGCNFPLFAFVLLSPLVVGDFLGSLAGFAAYALGKGSLLVVASVSVATSRGLTRERMLRVLPHVKRATGAILIAAGAYILWYWWTVLRPP